MLFKKFLSFVILITIAACGHYPELTERDRQPIMNDQFFEGLRKGYVELADWEAEQGDSDDAGHYRYKAQSAVQGYQVQPEDLTTRKIPTENLNELAEARNFLISAYALNAKQIAPAIAAEAQVRFDCWVEQQEENFQPEHIRNCKEMYVIAADRLGKALEPEEPEVVEMPGGYVVFFGFDDYILDDSAIDVVKNVAAEVEKFKPAKIMVSGHADKAGPDIYNQGLSEKRAQSVAHVLRTNGVDNKLIEVIAHGETKPQVETKDGVAERQNRFVKIQFAK